MNGAKVAAGPIPGFFFLFVAVILAVSAYPAAAENPPRLSLSPALDAGIAGTALLLGAGAFALELNAPEPGAPPSRLDTSSVNPLDRPFMRPYSEGIDTVSTAFALSALAFPALLSSAPAADWFPLGVMYVESVALTWGMKELGKNLFPRYRPYMYFSGYPESEIGDGDYRQSFPSGHASLAFTAAAFTAASYALYYPESSWRVPAVAGAYAVAASAAALRVASGSHYLTDVLSGAVLGTLSGWLVPVLHARFADRQGTGSPGNGRYATGVYGAGVLSLTLSPAEVRCTVRL